MQNRHRLRFVLLVIVTLGVVGDPSQSVADTIAEDAAKVNEAAKAAEFFARKAAQHKAAGNYKLCFDFAYASGAAAEAAKRLAQGVIDRINALPPAQQRQHFTSRTTAELDRDAAVQAAQSVEDCVNIVLALIALLLIALVLLFLWLRWRAFGPFFGPR